MKPTIPENKPEDASALHGSVPDTLLVRPIPHLTGVLTLDVQHKLTYDEVMERLADERTVKRDEVDPAVLTRTVWVSGNGSPGCLYDNGPNYHRTKADAIASCAFVFDEYKGVVTSLRKYHSWTCPDTHEVCEISESTINEIL